jgi:hypothetical protein
MNIEHVNKFEIKRKAWTEYLSGKDRNSILNQIYQMVWNTAVFRVISEARKYSTQNKNDRPEVNAMMHNFINRCFFDSQFSTIRRLTDNAYPLDHPTKGVASLCSLLKDMKKNACLMTRENMFKADGLEYDYTIVKQREEAYCQQRREKGVSSYCMPAELDSQNVKDRHRELDILCGVRPDQRTRRDCIQEKVFTFLGEKLANVTKEITVHVNKYVAHAATLGSREHDNAEEVAITFSYFWNAHKVICQVANFIDLYLLNRNYHTSFLPVPQYNHFEFIERPMVTKENVEMLDKVWQEFRRESDSWSSWGIDDFKKEAP